MISLANLVCILYINVILKCSQNIIPVYFAAYVAYCCQKVCRFLHFSIYFFFMRGAEALWQIYDGNARNMAGNPYCDRWRLYRLAIALPQL